MKPRRITAWIVMLLYVSVLSSCQTTETKEREKKPKEESVFRTASYQVGAVSQQSVAQTIQLPGEFKPFQEVSLYPKANGFVEKVNVDLGATVKKGQVLMVLDAPEIEEQLIAARSKYMKAEAVFVASKDNYRRMLESNKSPGAVSALDLEMAQSRMLSDSAAVMGERANFRALEKMKYYLTVRAPFDGVITERNVHPGALVGPGTKYAEPMLVIQEQSKLRLVVDIPETYSTRVGKGTVVKYTVNAVPGKLYEGKISRTSGSMNRRFRSETVEIDVENKQQVFKPGMFAEIILSAGGTPGALVVPSTSIVTSTERQYIIRLNEGKTQFVEIKPGNKADGMIEVFGDLQADDKVIINASTEIKEGTAIGS